MLNMLPNNEFDNMLSILALEENRNIPIVIKGANLTAEKTLWFLNKHGYDAERFLVDKEYYNKNNCELCKKPISILDDYILENECIVIVGCKGYNQGKIIQPNKAKYVFALDFVGRTCLLEFFDKPIDKDYIMTRRKEVEWVYSKLCDIKSEKALDDFIYQRLSGKYEKEISSSVQYFEEGIISISEDEVFIDCGAYRGDTIKDYFDVARKSGVTRCGNVIAFEPDEENYYHLKENTKQFDNVTIEKTGVYKESKVLRFSSGNKTNSSISDEGDITIVVKSIDSVLDGNKATFIKMDVEGSELDALKGAKYTISKYKPKLAIAIYHKREDFIDIPRYILSLRDDYKLYIRSYDAGGTDTILYAI